MEKKMAINIIKEIKNRGIVAFLFMLFSYPLRFTSLKNWRIKIKNKFLIKKIKKQYNLNFINELCSFYPGSLIEIFLDKVYSYFEPSENDIVLDVGATAGEYGIYCRSKGAKVYCFEMDKKAFQLMKAHIKLNKMDNIIPILCRVDDRKNSIDNYVRKFKISPTLIKIDVEGDEVNVLNGAKFTLKKFKPKIIVETHSNELKAKCLSILHKFNYKMVNKHDIAKNVEILFLK
ncbi:MAG: FkbM family methyltransferase [Candidatus Pacearchaeota archaeon]